MRVCIVTVAGHGLGGMQDHTQLLARGLAAAGHDVEVITARHPEGVVEESRYGARWHFLDTPAQHPRLPRRHPNWHRRCYEKFVQLHAERPFDVVHSESTSALDLVRRGVHHYVPVVPKFQGNYIGAVKAALRRARAGDLRVKVREAKSILWDTGLHLQRGEWRRFRPCEWMVSSNQQFRDCWRESFLRPERGHVVPNGIDVDLFRPRDQQEMRAELGLPPGLLFVCGGRLNWQKGTHHAIRALEMTQDALPDARLLVIGDGEERDALGRLVRDLGLDQSVGFLPAQPHDRLARYFAACDVFLFPTEREEGAPLILPLAMACGLPAVASSIGGVTEVIEEAGKRGLLVPPGDVVALTDAMRLLARDKLLRARLAEAARERIVDEYSIGRMIERTIEVYEIAIARLRSERGPRRRLRAKALTGATFE